MTEDPPEDDLVDKPLPRVSLAAKLASGIESEERDSPWAWYRAQRRGWSREQFEHWVDTGEEP